jgi:hypothetical protein
MAEETHWTLRDSHPAGDLLNVLTHVPYLIVKAQLYDDTRQRRIVGPAAQGLVEDCQVNLS